MVGAAEFLSAGLGLADGLGLGLTAAQAQHLLSAEAAAAAGAAARQLLIDAVQSEGLESRGHEVAAVHAAGASTPRLADFETVLNTIQNDEQKGIYADDVAALNAKQVTIVNEMADSIFREFEQHARWQNYGTLARGLAALAAVPALSQPASEKDKNNTEKGNLGRSCPSAAAVGTGKQVGDASTLSAPKLGCTSPELCPALEQLRSRLELLLDWLGGNIRSAVVKHLHRAVIGLLERWILSLARDGTQKAAEEVRVGGELDSSEATDESKDMEGTADAALSQLRCDCHSIFELFRAANPSTKRSVSDRVFRALEGVLREG
jgi:hypothetical protein